MAVYKKQSDGTLLKVGGNGDVIDGLNSTSSSASLSANQGRILDVGKSNRSDISGLVLFGPTNTSGSSITSGTYFYLNNTLVKALTNIAANASFTLNTNYSVVKVGDELSTLNSKRIRRYIGSDPLTIELPSASPSCIVSFSSSNYMTAMYLVTFYYSTYGVVTKIVDNNSALSISLSSDNTSITITNNTQRAGLVYILSL